ncbi:MAG: D-alanyl-D-alanine carboxypeptidase/D-alanyl-D-alanine-endopeptidase [Saprospiraceae bacterium]|nr:D-alanyl-D-alanine carboxypeptidase/D-alanyl-D-alanine-endopeptidase [Saprospiraceae bacterium]
MPYCNHFSWLIFSFICFYASEIYPQNLHSKRHLHKITKQFVKNDLLKHASISFQIYDLKTKKSIASYDDQRSLIPASIQKILSCATVLKIAGQDFQYKTPVYLLGKKSTETIFDGDLVFKGSADPSFASPLMPGVQLLDGIADSIYFNLNANGIKTIRGDIIVDEHFVSDVPENPEWLYYDLANYYGAGCFGFNFMENRAKIVLKSSDQDGSICPIDYVSPSILTSFYQSKLVGWKDLDDPDVFVIGSATSCLQEVRGNWRCCNSDSMIIYSALNKPSEVFKDLLKLELIRRGIQFELRQHDDRFDSTLVMTIHSPKLEKLCSRALGKSVNLYCESFLHQIGYQLNQTTDRKQAIQSLENMIKKLFYWKDANGFVLEDGSGLSPKNMLSAWQMNQFLLWLDFNSGLTNFWTLLPDAMQDSKLKHSIRLNKKYNFGLRLKSGSMERVKTYAGYITENSKPRYCVSILINHYTCSGEEMNALLGNLFNQLLN